MNAQSRPCPPSLNHQIFDRVAKGIREAPSKALMGELAAAGGDSPAAAFGLRQSLGTLGALGGALAAGAALRATRGNYSLTFALACAPAAAALALVAAAFGRGSGVGSSAHAVKQAEDQGSVEENGAAPAISSLSPLAKARALAAGLRPAYWQALAVVGILYFSRFDAGFATLRAKSVMPAAALPALIPCMMVPQGILAAPAGLLAKASVRARNRVLLGGMAAMVAADACFAFAPSPAGMVAGALMLGIHMAATHGVSLAMLASYIPAGSLPGLGRIAGTAWSLTDLLLGVVLAASNLLAGRLADTTAARGVGGIGCFLGGAAAATLSAAALLLFSAFGELGLEDALETSNRGGAPAAAAALDAQQQLQDGTGQEQAQFKTG
ncbi:MFS transporter isoform B [Micractinium conductrix]|uniref:MFS transporter isoform B n=1 Tax=Micractinium conductrix TaxID=554055 RepID=A0A2P6V7T5_9CHLO|nr:MFS transporter isoform B [Micractinium conductrix]|eukprot:PSC70151.1 MFS transporter isoform B [Micractinium conductrix]